MNIENLFDIHEQALNLRVKRAEVLASNISNADTPGYKAKDMEFDSVLKEMDNNQKGMNATDKGHLSGNGYGVSDIELTERANPCKLPWMVMALQASSLVGKNVDVKTDNGLYMQGNNVKGSIDVPAYATNVQMEIRNEQGEVINTVKMNAVDKGELALMWDGLDDNGNAQPSGVYRFIAKANVSGQEIQIDTYLSANVESITINKNGQPVTLNVSFYGKISMDDIKTIS